MTATTPSLSAQNHAATLEQAEPMRALLQTAYGSSDVLRLGTAARPTPGPGEVLVRVHAAGIDRGTWHLMTGRPYLMRLMGFGFFSPKRRVPGLDLAGTVIEVGPGVTRFRVGDEVFGIGNGSFAELATAREDKLSLRPSTVSRDQAAVLGVSAITALQALDKAAARAGERVLIIGASGGVGTYAVQIARAQGLHVTAVCRGSKVEAVRALGADRVIDYERADFADGSERYDVILDLGGNTKLGRLRRALTPTGRLVFVGGENGGDLTAGFERQLLAFALAPFVKQRFIMMAASEDFESLERVAALAGAGQLRPVVDRTVGLAAVPSAIDALVAGQVTGKIVVHPGA